MGNSDATCRIEHLIELFLLYSTGVDAALGASGSDEKFVPALLYSGSEHQLGLRHPDYCRRS